MTVEAKTEYNLVLNILVRLTCPEILDIMASMPFGMHAAQKVRESMSANATSSGYDKDSKSWQGTGRSNGANFLASKDVDQAPSKYCEKMMNSIWGLYNRYSVHNFKSMPSDLPQNSAEQSQPSAQQGQGWLQKPIKYSLDGKMQMKF